MSSLEFEISILVIWLKPGIKSCPLFQFMLSLTQIGILSITFDIPMNQSWLNLLTFLNWSQWNFLLIQNYFLFRSEMLFYTHFLKLWTENLHHFDFLCCIDFLYFGLCFSLWTSSMWCMTDKAWVAGWGDSSSEDQRTRLTRAGGPDQCVASDWSRL